MTVTSHEEYLNTVHQLQQLIGILWLIERVVGLQLCHGSLDLGGEVGVRGCVGGGHSLLFTAAVLCLLRTGLAGLLGWIRRITIIGFPLLSLPVL